MSVDPVIRRSEHAAHPRNYDRDLDEIFAVLAAQSVVRFLDGSENPDASTVSSRSAHRPTAHNKTERQTPSLSRPDAGSQEAALASGPNQPEPGESDTSGGSNHGRA